MSEPTTILNNVTVTKSQLLDALKRCEPQREVFDLMDANTHDPYFYLSVASVRAALASFDRCNKNDGIIENNAGFITVHSDGTCYWDQAGKRSIFYSGKLARFTVKK